MDPWTPAGGKLKKAHKTISLVGDTQGRLAKDPGEEMQPGEPYRGCLQLPKHCDDREHAASIQ
jgi:hypothetical protein